MARFPLGLRWKGTTRQVGQRFFWILADFLLRSSSASARTHRPEQPRRSGSSDFRVIEHPREKCETAMAPPLPNQPDTHAR